MSWLEQVFQDDSDKTRVVGLDLSTGPDHAVAVVMDGDTVVDVIEACRPMIDREVMEDFYRGVAAAFQVPLNMMMPRQEGKSDLLSMGDVNRYSNFILGKQQRVLNKFKRAVRRLGRGAPLSMLSKRQRKRRLQRQARRITRAH